MVTNLRKKNSRHRGSSGHGYGEKKKHRGAGSRGGRGNAGSGKRGDAKKPSYWKLKDHEGSSGFTHPNPNKESVTSIARLNALVSEFVMKGVAKKDGSKVTVDLDVAGFDKVIATGVPAFEYDISVKKATPGAVKKIEEHKGSVAIIASDSSSVDKSEKKVKSASKK